MNDDRNDALDALSKRIEAAKSRHEPKKPEGQEGHAAGELGWRMVTELVSGILIGCGIGYGIDTLAGTMPIFLILFLMLGLAAGVRTMMRSAQAFQEKQSAGGTGSPEAAEERDETRGD